MISKGTRSKKTKGHLFRHVTGSIDGPRHPEGTNEVNPGNVPGTYKIRVQALPEKGKANAAIIKNLAIRLGVSKKQIRIERGESSRDKLLARVSHTVLLRSAAIADADKADAEIREAAG